MGYNLLINGVYWGCNPLILTIDPNFQRDIQVAARLYFSIFRILEGPVSMFQVLFACQKKQNYPWKLTAENLTKGCISTGSIHLIQPLIYYFNRKPHLNQPLIFRFHISFPGKKFNQPNSLISLTPVLEGYINVQILLLLGVTSFITWHLQKRGPFTVEYTPVI